MLYYETIDNLRALHRYRGYWFDGVTTSFFKSRYENTAVADSPDAKEWYFISSERDGAKSRRYSVRVFRVEAEGDGTKGGNSSIDTVGDFMGYASKTAAIRARNKYLPVSFPNA